MRILGIDPGSRATGYGIIEMHGNRLAHVAHGTIATSSSDPLPARLAAIFLGLRDVLALHRPAEVGVENIFNAHNAQSALKLGHARGVALLAAELDRLPLEEYTPMQVKSAVVGYGHATKEQVQEMVRRLLALPERVGADASDALAVAICHAQTRSTLKAYARAVAARPAIRGRTRGVRLPGDRE
ncbi:MAG TPA: crossover junction endodeoxyribonuclease RuvC [Geobacteraceae bacterium]